MTQRTIKIGRKTVPVTWQEFTKGDPETCDSSTQGVTFPPNSKRGLVVIINSLYPVYDQRATMLHELWHVVEFSFDIRGYSHKNMNIIMDRIWMLVERNKWLREFIWS